MGGPAKSEDDEYSQDMEEADEDDQYTMDGDGDEADEGDAASSSKAGGRAPTAPSSTAAAAARTGSGTGRPPLDPRSSFGSTHSGDTASLLASSIMSEPAGGKPAPPARHTSNLQPIPSAAGQEDSAEDKEEGTAYTDTFDEASAVSSRRGAGASSNVAPAESTALSSSQSAGSARKLAAQAAGSADSYSRDDSSAVGAPPVAARAKSMQSAAGRSEAYSEAFEEPVEEETVADDDDDNGDGGSGRGTSISHKSSQRAGALSRRESSSTSSRSSSQAARQQQQQQQQGADLSASNMTEETDMVDMRIIPPARTASSARHQHQQQQQQQQQQEEEEDEQSIASQHSTAQPVPTHSSRQPQQATSGGASHSNWVDDGDSWEGELQPTIIPAHQHRSSGAGRPPPGLQRPMSAAVISQRTTADHSVGDGLSMTSGSVVGSLVAMPVAGGVLARGGPRSRPSSAGAFRSRGATAPGAASATAADGLLSRHPSTWDVRDVADWVVHIGMEQYRKRFLHNCVNGRLLLGLNDHVLKVELGVGPLGHRAAILEAIQMLQQQAGEDAAGMLGEPRLSLSPPRARPQSARPTYGTSGSPAAPDPRARPASASRVAGPGGPPPEAFLGPALGKVTVYEQRAKLLYELDRAAARAAQHRSLVAQLSRTAELSAEEVAHLKGLLADLERKNKMAVQHAEGGVDSCGRVPWRPPSPHKTILSFGECATGPVVPRMSHKSRELLAETQGAHQSPTFLERLEADQRRRERSLTELEQRTRAAETPHADPLLQRRRQLQDHAFLSRRLQDKGVLSAPLSNDIVEADETLSGVVETCKDVWQIPDAEFATIMRARHAHKVKLLAAAIRTREFMSRYEAEEADRRSGAKTRSLQDKWWQTGNKSKQSQDMEQCVQYFGLLGWGGEDGITDARLAALLRRASAYKTAYEKWRDLQAAGTAGDVSAGVDFSQPPFSSDGLTPLQEAAGATLTLTAETAALSATGGGMGVAKAPLAPAGTVQVVPTTGQTLDYLTYTVRLLARCRWDDLQKMEAWADQAKQLGVYRHIRTQKFIEFTESMIRTKERKLQETYEGMQPQRRVITKTAMDGFFDRLMDDGAKRRATAEKLVQAKAEKEAAILKSSAMYRTRPRSAR